MAFPPRDGLLPKSAPSSGSPTPLSTQGVNYSHNWAGYIVNTYGYTDIQAVWNVPQGLGNGDVYAYSASWVGLNLGSSQTYALVQAGSESDGDSVNTNRYLWWEAYPLNYHLVDQLFSWGDTISVHVTAANYSGATFHIDDMTSGFNQTYSYSASGFRLDGHAEWLLERLGSTFELAQSTTSFSNANAAATTSGIGWTAVGNLPNYRYIMTTCDGTLTLATPTAISNGNQFTVNWQGFGGGWPDRNC